LKGGNLKKEHTNYQFHQELGGLEIVNASYHQRNFAKHSHEGYAINVIEQGTQKFLRSGQSHMAPKHSIIFVNADDVHTGQAATNAGWSYQGMYPLEQQFSKLALDLGYGKDFAPYFPEAVVEDHQMANELRILFNLLSNSTNTLLRETMLYGVLTRLMVKHSRARLKLKKPSSCNDRLALVQQFIHDNLEQNISLESLSILSGITPFYLVRQFQQAYGLPPHAYQIQQRLHKGRMLLRKGFTVAHIAVELGFHDQSHFHRYFKKALGIAPASYAKQVRS